jgi:hypothetical protein
MEWNEVCTLGIQRDAIDLEEETLSLLLLLLMLVVCLC